RGGGPVRNSCAESLIARCPAGAGPPRGARCRSDRGAGCPAVSSAAREAAGVLGVDPDRRGGARVRVAAAVVLRSVGGTHDSCVVRLPRTRHPAGGAGAALEIRGRREGPLRRAEPPAPPEAAAGP